MKNSVQWLKRGWGRHQLCGPAQSRAAPEALARLRLRWWLTRPCAGYEGQNWSRIRIAGDCVHQLRVLAQVAAQR